MKTVYIPRGETVHYETLVTDHLVVKGYLDVTYGVKAKTISGSGVICAGSAEADSIRIDSLEAATAICKRLIAKRVQAPEVFASESAVVSCFLSAAYVETGRLTVSISEIDEVKADEVINLTKEAHSVRDPAGRCAALLLGGPDRAQDAWRSDGRRVCPCNRGGTHRAEGRRHGAGGPRRAAPGRSRVGAESRAGGRRTQPVCQHVQIGAGGRFHLEDRPRHSRGERARVQL